MPDDTLSLGDLLLAPIETTEEDGFLAPAPAPDDGTVAMSMMKGAEVNPDQRAADIDLSKRSGQNINLIADDNREEINRQTTQNNAVNMTRETPVVRNWLTRDDLLAPIAHDDIPNLVKSEKTAKDLTFTGVLSSGVDLLQGLGWRFVEATGEATGLEEIEALGQAGAEENFAAVSRDTGQRRQRFMKIDTAGDFFQWMKETSAEQIPLMAPALVGGVAGATLGSAAGPAGTIIGGVLGTFIPSFVLGAGETQQAIKERDIGTEAPGVAFGAGALIAALDSALPGRVGTKLVKAFGLDVAEQVLKLSATRIMKNAAKEGGKGMALEGITEAIQEVISETAAAAATDTKIDAEDLTEQMIEAFAAGAFLGGATSTAASAVGDTVKAKRVKRQMEVLNDQVNESKVRGRDQEKHSEVVADQMNAGGVDAVFVSPEAVLEFANQHEGGVIDALRQLGVVDDLDDAVRNNRPVEISTENFSRTVLGSKGFNILSSHIKLDPQDKSFVEAAESLVSGKDIETELASELEAYDASVELKERVTQTLSKVKKGTVAQAIENAPQDVNSVLLALFQDIQDRKSSVVDEIRSGRVKQLDTEIAEADRAVDEAQVAIDTAVSEARATKALQKRQDKAIAARDKLVDEQLELNVPGKAAEIDPASKEAVRKEEAQEKGVSKKIIQTKGKVLSDLNVKITTEAVRATRAAFRAAIKIGKTLIDRKTALLKEIKKMPLSDKQKLQLTNRIDRAKTDEALTKIAAAVQSRASVLVDRNRRQQIKQAIKRELKKTAAKSLGGKPIGGFDADTQEFLDKARKIMNLPIEAAQEKLLTSLQTSMTEPFPDPFTLVERQLLALAANSPDLGIVDAENLLLTVADIKATGLAAGLQRTLAKRRAKDRDVEVAREATTQGVPTAQIKTTGFFSRMKKKAVNIQTSLASMHNGWDEVLDITFNKKGQEVQQLIENLRITKEVQKMKGRVIRWEQQFQDMAMEAFRITGVQDLHEKHVEDNKREDFGLFENAREETVRLEYSRAEIRKLWMEFQDPTINDVVHSENGMAFTPEMSDALFDVLTDQDKQFARAQLDFYKKLYPQINAVYRRMYGVNLPFNEFYSPIQRDLKQAGDDVKDTFGSDIIFADEQTFRRQLPKEIKSRTKTSVPLLRRSDIGAMRRYLHDMAWFVEGSEKTMHIKSVFKSEKLRGDIAANHGTNMNLFIDGFLEDFGTGYAARGNVAEKTLNVVNRLFAGSVLALKGTIGTKQLVSWFAMADNVPATEFISSHVDFFKSPTAAKKIVKFLWDSSPALRERGSSLDFELAKIGSLEEPVFRWKKENVWEKWKFSIIKMGDRFPIYAGGWAVYQHAIKSGKSHKQAIEAFEDAFSTTQQSTDIDKLSALQRMGAVGRTLTMFMTARMALLRGETRAFRQVSRGKITWREFGKRIGYYHFIMPMAIQYIASGFRWEEDRQLIAAVIGQLNSFVILGDVLMLAAENVFSEDRPWASDDELPLKTMLKDMWKGVDDAISADGDMEEMLIAIGEMADVAATLAGQPLDQVRNIIGGVGDVIEGETEKGLKRIWGFSERVAEDSSK